MSRRNRPRKKKHLRFFGVRDWCIHNELVRLGFKVRRGRRYLGLEIARYYWKDEIKAGCASHNGRR